MRRLLTFVIVPDCTIVPLRHVAFKRTSSKINDSINIISKWMINYTLSIFKLVNFTVWKNDNKNDIFCIIICFICISRINTVAYSNDYSNFSMKLSMISKYVYKTLTFYGKKNSWEIKRLMFKGYIFKFDIVIIK